MSITEEVAHRVASRRDGADDPDVRRLVSHCLVDWIACAVGGVGESPAQIASAMAMEQGATPVATLVGSANRTSPSLAAHANGVISHALDFDDANLTMPGHPGVVLFPGLLALAEARQYSGHDVVDAFLAGYDGACRIGAMVAPGHYARGFHATATIGTFASALACARLIGLDTGATRRAMGIAATQAAGLISMFGTGTKPLHAGNAAANGLSAALLAERGLTSNEDVLDCVSGFAATHSSDCRIEAARATPRYGHYIRENLFKVHAACYGTHAAIECAAQVRRAHATPITGVRSVRVAVGEECARTCNIERPTTGAQARFSLRFNVAAGLLDLPTGKVATYCDETCRFPALLELLAKIDVVFVPGRPLTQADMQVRFDDGAEASGLADTSLPMLDLEAQEVILLQKFDDLTANWPDLEAMQALRFMALGIDQLADVGTAMRLLAVGHR